MSALFDLSQLGRTRVRHAILKRNNTGKRIRQTVLNEENSKDKKCSKLHVGYSGMKWYVWNG